VQFEHVLVVGARQTGAGIAHHGLGDQRYTPCPLLRQYVQAGRLGRKSGHSFHTYP
jgi:hypothetical protein